MFLYKSGLVKHTTKAIIKYVVYEESVDGNTFLAYRFFL